MSMSKSIGGIGQTVQEEQVIHGKRYAGDLHNVHPFFGFGETKKHRCVYGELGKDYKNRGFDNRQVRTSIVQYLAWHEGKIFAITMNSAYKLVNVHLHEFLASDAWANDIVGLHTGKVETVQEENKID